MTSIRFRQYTLWLTTLWLLCGKQRRKWSGRVGSRVGTRDSMLCMRRWVLLKTVRSVTGEEARGAGAADEDAFKDESTEVRQAMP
jgi:hypothetical protein